MFKLLQVTVWGLLVAAATAAEEKAFQYRPPVVEAPLFGKNTDMLEQERDQYATNLSGYAAGQVVAKKASPESLEMARRIVALAMHLSPRNRQTLVINFQLKNGVLPEEKKGDYSPAVLSRLLLTRGRLLQQKEVAESKLLARCFIELAAVIDPRNEDAVFAYELQRLDDGDLDWAVVTDARKKDAGIGQTAP
ncbi:MAG: hypothetical protein HKN82_19635 [Akkermansiaceae bacterium]|nr:hypothetical protein [Akkermansiaceae bacterium]NNM28729.1 hypothetical protein [Akkermansiaceae bacterium]